MSIRSTIGCDSYTGEQRKGNPHTCALDRTICHRVSWWVTGSVGECTRVTDLRWLGNRDRDPPVPANHEGLCTRCRAQSRATRRYPSPARWHQRRTWQWHASHARMSASCESCNGVMSETAMMHGGRAILLVSTQAETTSSSSASDGRPADASQCICVLQKGVHMISKMRTCVPNHASGKCVQESIVTMGVASSMLGLTRPYGQPSSPSPISHVWWVE